MTVRVYFSKYADDPFAVELLHQLLDEYWTRIEAAKEAQSAELMVVIAAEIINTKLLQQAAVIAQTYQGQQSEVMRLVGVSLIAKAVFVETLRCWLTTDALELMFVEEHGMIVDKQMRFYELTGTRGCFFGLLHLCLGTLCEARDKELSGGTPQRHTFQISQNQSAPESGARLSLLDILTPIFERTRQATNLESEMSERLRVMGRHLLLGSETLTWLSSQQQ